MHFRSVYASVTIYGYYCLSSITHMIKYAKNHVPSTMKLRGTSVVMCVTEWY